MNDPDIRKSCTRSLSYHGFSGPREQLLALADYAPEDEAADVYGAGGAVARLEERTAALLGKPAARFFIKGMTAQYCALRVHAEARGTDTVAIHPQGHIASDEGDGLERVAGLKAVRLGRYQPFDLAALQAVEEKLAAVVVELPLRRSGYLLPPLDELRAMSAWCREEGIPLHFDGARLWETAAGYDVALNDLADLADTVYVSYYKGLGGLGGAALVGDDAFIRRLAPWKTRFAGNLATAFPQALSALAGIDQHLARMPEYVRRARDLAGVLASDGRIIVHPVIPHANSFQLLLPGTSADLDQRHAAFARQHGVWLFNAFTESPIEGRSIAEVVIGAASDTWENGEVARWIDALLAA
jgi:threonine aldolase